MFLLFNPSSTLFPQKYDERHSSLDHVIRLRTCLMALPNGYFSYSWEMRLLFHVGKLTPQSFLCHLLCWGSVLDLRYWTVMMVNICSKVDQRWETHLSLRYFTGTVLEQIDKLFGGIRISLSVVLININVVMPQRGCWCSVW